MAERRRDRLRARRDAELRHGRPSCVRTVSGEMKSSRPIDSFECPSASSRSTSRSRGVSPRSWAGSPGSVHRRGRVDVHASARDRPERAHERGKRRVLEHVAAGAGVEHLVSTAPRRIRSRRHRRLGRRPRDAPDDGGAGKTGHAQVEHGESRPLRLHERDGFVPVSRSPHDPETLQLEKARDALEHGRMVVGDDTRGPGRNGAHGPVVGHRPPKLRGWRDAEAALGAVAARVRLPGGRAARLSALRRGGRRGRGVASSSTAGRTRSRC